VCDVYQLPSSDTIAVVDEFAGACSFLQMAVSAKKANALALMITSQPFAGVGRYQRVSQLGTIDNFPVVNVAYNVTQYLLKLLQRYGLVTVQLVPGVNPYAVLVYDTAWWWTCSMLIVAMFIGVFLFTLYKFVNVVLSRGWRFTILHVLILLHAAAQLVLIVAWIDPYYSRGLYTYGGSLFLQWFPLIILANAAALLSFYWLEAIITIGGTKTSPFLTETKIPYLIFATVSAATAIFGSAFLGALLYTAYDYMAVVSFVLELGLAIFFVIIGAKTIHFAKSLKSEVKVSSKINKLEISIAVSATLLLVYVLLSALAYYLTTVIDNIYLPFVPKFFTAILAASITVVQLFFIKTQSVKISTSSLTNKSTIDQ